MARHPTLNTLERRLIGKAEVKRKNHPQPQDTLSTPADQAWWRTGRASFTQKTQSDLKGGAMYRVFVIAGLCVLAIIVTVGQLGRYLGDYKAADGQRQDTQYAQQDFLNAERQQRARDCYHCGISLADLSLSDATSDGVTITNHSKNTLEEITFEVTMKDCPPGYNPATANSADRCVIEGQESKGVDVFIPPGQARGFHSRMNFHDVPLPPQSRRFFLWRIVSAKGVHAP
jgi:hypothetical protein